MCFAMVLHSLTLFHKQIHRQVFGMEIWNRYVKVKTVELCDKQGDKKYLEHVYRHGFLEQFFLEKN